MVEIPVSEMRLGDVRRRAIVSVGGQQVSGVVERVGVWGRLENNPIDDWYSVTLRVGKGRVESGNLPGDFMVQVEREESE